MKFVTYFTAIVLTIFALSGCGGGSTTAQEEVPDFSLKVTADAYEGDTGDNNFSTAGEMDISTTERHTIFPQNDNDFVKIILEKNKRYEFFVANLPATGDSNLYLYDENYTEIKSADDYIDLDSNINYVATYSGIYYLKVVSLDAPYGIFEYTLGAREFVDDDNDTYSSYYDCDDSNSSIHPHAREIPGNGIDEDCSGVDALAGADPYEADNDMTDAKAIPTTLGDPWEIEFRKDIYSQMRTLDTTSDIDYMSIMIPPQAKVDITIANRNFRGINWSISESNGTVKYNGTNGFGRTLYNRTNTDLQLYLKIASDGSDTGWYVPVMIPLGTDADEDNVSTKDYWEYDCDDNNASIYPGATDVVGDGIDANCNGVDG